MIIVGSFLPEPFWLVSATKFTRVCGSRRCYGINSTHPMKEDVKKKIILPALKGDASVVTCIQPCLLLRGVFGFAPLYRCVFPRRCQPQLLFPCRRFHLASSKSTPFGSEATQAKTLA